MWKDVDIQLRKQQDGDVLIMAEEDAIVNSLYNIFTTMQGDRRMLPEFPSPTHSLLFEPVDEITAEKIGYAALDSINKWDDRVAITNVHINANEDDNQYEAGCTFTTKNSLNEPQTFDFILKQQG